MKEDQELKHVCKFCNKSFPSGRSLGGHMRSHLINSPFDHTKKTSKFAKSSEDTLLTNKNKICKECGKSFQCWKALFGHMKCHSDKVSSINSTMEEEDSWNNDLNHAIHKQVIMDSLSDSTETAAPNKKKRSSRKIKRYMTAATISSTITVANASPCVSKIDQEQEEVAMSLIILSRDAGNWAGPNLCTEFSRNKYGELVKLKKIKNGSKSNVIHSRIPRNAYNISEVPTDKQKKIKGDKVSRIEECEIEVPNKFVNSEMDSDQKESCSKRKHFEMNECDFSVDSDTKKLKDQAFDFELIHDSEKKMKFQCTNCNKRFHSYQALGGHRASHKRTNKGCEKVVTDIEHLQNQAADSKLIKNSSNDSTLDEFGEIVETSCVSKKIKGYECPICFKIFQSGQALGGHKRSHLITESKGNNKSIIIQEPTDEIRDLLDLNLPAPVEEESSEHVGFQPWWIGSSHKHEQLIGLISN
ncbi:hypothetical protein K7X08_022421 [Anisodus acutangulus]|uniref:C2H2-type domain-containing protein n=1 Tax=Anisodus acutangulus TaxID=402998 RepID=A0A9Q1MHZ6_9SOLA|nr:hypothetical protein K7X08_022421 [Anisodus acutangulus]